MGACDGTSAHLRSNLVLADPAISVLRWAELLEVLLVELLLLLLLDLLPQLWAAVIGREAVDLLAIGLLAGLVLERGLLVGHEALGVVEGLGQHGERGMAICHKWAGPVPAVADGAGDDVAVACTVEH